LILSYKTKFFLKWCWLANSYQQCFWNSMLNSIRINIPNSYAPDTNHISFFIRVLATLQPIYKASVQQGTDGTPQWRWHVIFTVKSVYKLCNKPGVILLQYWDIWSLKAPPKVEIFPWLLLHNRHNTANNLQNKGWAAIGACVLCTSKSSEIAIYLFHDYCSLHNCASERWVYA
jgi:zinc-binding in reverse transcriptase